MGTKISRHCDHCQKSISDEEWSRFQIQFQTPAGPRVVDSCEKCAESHSVHAVVTKSAKEDKQG